MEKAGSASRVLAGRRSVSVATILIAYVLLHTYLIANTLGGARDGARYLGFALRLEEESWQEVFRGAVDHPAYPLAVRAAFELGDAVGWSGPAQRIVLAQAVSALAGLIVVLTFYRLASRVWSPLPAWCAAFTFIFLPRPAMYTSDVISDALYAAFWLLGAASVIRGLDTRRLPPFLAGGFFAALAYFTRVDAFSLVLTVLVVLSILAVRAREDRMWSSRRRIAAAGGLFLLPVLSLLAWFVSFYGSPSPKPSFDVIFSVPEAAAAAEMPAPDTGVPFWWAVYHVGAVAAQQVRFVHGVLLVAAFWFALRARAVSAPSLFVWCALFVYWLILAVVEVRLGYLEGRYALCVLPLFVGMGMHGADEIAARLRSTLEGPLRRTRLGGWLSPGLVRPAFFAAVVLGSLAVSLPSLAGRHRHATLHGAVEAGAWLAREAEPDATIHDPYFYPTYLAGLRDRRRAAFAPPAGAHPHYVIAEDRHLDVFPALRELIENGSAREVASFPRRAGSSKTSVRVWRIEPSRSREVRPADRR